MSLSQLTDSDSDFDEAAGSRADVDIVAVHGLYEQTSDTWTEPVGKTLWLRDIFPHKKYNARVLAYSYPTQNLISDEHESVQLLPYATNLVAELYADREGDNGVERPIIFVCHGFGGLLVKGALIHSRKSESVGSEHLKSIYISTRVVLFFGTPHDGVDEAFLLAACKASAREAQRVPRALLKNSDFLNDLADRFAPLRKRFRVHYFAEGKQTSIGDRNTWVVPYDSAKPIWDETPGCLIFNTHSDMVKFKDQTSPGCKVALEALKSFWPNGPSEIRTRWEDEHSQRFEERKRRARDELSLPHRDSLQTSNVSEAHDAHELQEYHVPHASSNYFIGRQKHALEAKDLLGPIQTGRRQGKPKVLVIHGLGGSGKTQFALRFAEDNRDRYRGIFWADASSNETLETNFASLGTAISKGSSRLSAVYWLSQRSKPWLLILDNADDPEMDLTDYIPSAGNGHIMITTRNPEASVYSTVGCIKLSGMDPEDAITLLLRSAYPGPGLKSQDPSKQGVAAAIAERLGYLAIALTHAGATIRKNIYTLEAYLHHYLGHRRVMVRSSGAQIDESADTIATWELPFQKMSRKDKVKHKDAVDLFHLFTFMHFESIPEQIFRRSWHNLFTRTSDSQTSPQIPLLDGPFDQTSHTRFREAVRVLYDYSLIDHDPERETCSLHPVVQRWAQERLALPEQMRWLNLTITILAYCISPHLEASGRRFRHSLLPHIHACLRGLQNRGTVLPDTLSRAVEIERFASVYAEYGRWEVAKSWQERVIKFRRKKAGWWHHDTLQARGSLAETQWNLFEIRAASETQRHILLLRWFVRPSLGYWASWPPWKPDHVDYCLALDNLGRTLWLAGDRVWSRHVGERAMQGLTKRLGPDDPRTLNAAFNLARTYLHLGDQQLSHRLLIKVLVKRKRLFGMDHPDTLMTRNELGINLCAHNSLNEPGRQRKLAAAEALVRNVLNARKRILGAEHAYTLWSVNDLSKVLCERQRSADAAALLVSILDIVKRTLGEGHVGMTMTRSNLARAYSLSERWQDAELLLSRLIGIIPPEDPKTVGGIIPPDHPDSINARSGLVHVPIRMGKLAEAEAECNKLLDMMKEKQFEKILAPDSPRAMRVYEQMLEIYYLQNRTADLEALSLKVPAAKVPSPKIPFNMLPTRKILRTESELERLSGSR